MKRLISYVLLGGILLLGGCTGTNRPSALPSPPVNDSKGDNTTVEDKNPVATIEMENGAKIVLELYPDKAPNTVLNFIHLANDGYYDGLIFHRISPDFMIQGGCPDGTGSGNPGYSIKGEFSSNGFEGNDISHQPGVISMARSLSMDSAGSQFFICDGDASHLDGAYAAFGMVIEGMEVVQEIANQPMGVVSDDDSGRPAKDQIMKTVTVETFGKDFPKPEIIK